MRGRAKRMGAEGPLATMAVVVGLLSTGSCLVAKPEHCALAFGDASCRDAAGLCVLAKGKASYEGVEGGCSADVPEGFVPAPYGLPTRIDAAEGEPEDPLAVQGVLATHGYGACGSVAELESHFEPVIGEVAAVRRHLDEAGRVRRAALDLDGAHVEGLAAYEAAVVAWIDRCGMGTETGSTTTEETTTVGVETDTESSTTALESCMSEDECSDPTPFCNLEVPDMGVCVDCDGMPDPHAACAGMNADTPVCLDDVCVQCTAAMDDACTGLTPVCDAETNTCIPCTAHEECGQAACNLFTGACLPPVPFPPGQTLADAISGVTEGAFILPAGAVYDESVTVNDGQVIAFRAAELGPGVEPPLWIRSSGNVPQLTVSTGATVLLDGMQLAGNASSMVPGLLVDGGQAWLDRSRIVLNFGGGIVAQNNATLTVRNCFVGDGSNGQHALSVDGSSATVLSTTLGVGVDNFGEVFPVYCSGSVDVTIRNSLLVSFDGTPEISCSSAMVTNTASETLIPGMGNVALGPIAMDWFLNITAGDFHLDNPPASVDATARWTANDPPTDIDGNPRPMRDGTPDFAGADVP